MRLYLILLTCFIFLLGCVPIQNSATEYLQSEPEIDLELTSKQFQFYQIDLAKKSDVPKQFLSKDFVNRTKGLLSPSKTFMIVGYELQDFLIWDCINQKEVIGENANHRNSDYFDYAPIQFLGKDSLFSIERLPMVTQQGSDQDENGYIVSVDGTERKTTFSAQLANATEQNVSINSIYLDRQLNRYYAVAEIWDNSDFHDEMQYGAAEYDENGLLLNCIITKGMKPPTIKGFNIGHSIVAGGERFLLSSMNIEFNFNNGTWRRTDYLPNMRDLNFPEIIGEGNSPFSIYDGEAFYLRNYDYQHALVGYENGVFQVYYELTEQTEEENPYEVQTEQGPVQMQYTVSGSAPRKDFYFTAPCEEYAWTVSEQWESLLSAEKYTKGVFKTNTDGKIEFICPLPEDVDYIGEDINGLSYFYDRREI